MTSRLILSFWDLCLDNLPQGCFERSTIPASEARSMIRTARADNVLLCVSEDDLLAPYNERPRRRHAALCAVLQNAYDIALSFEDFLSSYADQDGAVHSVTPLQVVSLQPGERMLVVTCSYIFAKADRAGDPEERFVIAEDSVGFNLIAALPQPTGPAS